MFGPITLKHLNSLTAIDLFSWLGGREVTIQTAVEKVSDSIPGSSKDVYVCFFVFVIIFVNKFIIYMQLCKFFCNASSFRKRNILQCLWPIIRVLR